LRACGWWSRRWRFGLVGGCPGAGASGLYDGAGHKPGAPAMGPSRRWRFGLVGGCPGAGASGLGVVVPALALRACVRYARTQTAREGDRENRTISCLLVSWSPSLPAWAVVAVAARPPTSASAGRARPRYRR